MTDEQERDLAGCIRTVTQFLQLIQHMPDDEMPAPVTIALKRSADIAMDRCLVLCLIFSQISSDAERDRGASDVDMMADYLAKLQGGEA